jgi:hypothetical protein
MAQFYTDFSEALTAVDRTWSLDHLEPTENPGGRGFHDGFLPGYFSVQEVGGEKVIRHQKGLSTTARAGLWWPSAGLFADCEALCCVYVDASTTGKRPAVLLRAGGKNATERGYTFEARKTENKVQISKYVDGTYTALTSAAYTFSTGWYWIRANATGTNLYLRIWADGGSEPGTWTLTTTDNALAFGYCGVFDFEGNNYISYFKDMQVTGTPLHQSDWRWGWGDVALAYPRVVSDAGYTGGKALGVAQFGADGRGLFLWEDVVAADIKVLAKFKPAVVGAGTQLFRVRAQGYGGTENGYTLRPNAAGDAVELVALWRGELGSLGSGACTWAANDWNMVRFEAVGNALKAKVWPASGAEPGSWSVEATDSGAVERQAMGQAGWFGVGSYGSTATITWDTIAIGTEGDAVP